jgi:hypothetical protein
LVRAASAESDNSGSTGGNTASPAPALEAVVAVAGKKWSTRN